jgi:hypothetical protein
MLNVGCDSVTADARQPFAGSACHPTTAAIVASRLETGSITWRGAELCSPNG